MSFIFEQKSEGDKQSSISIMQNANTNNLSNLSQTPSSYTGSGVKYEKKVSLKDEKAFVKSIANVVDKKGKKKRKIIKHCKDDPVPEPEKDDAESEKDECPYKFSTDDEFYLAFHSKFYQDFKISNQNNSLTLSSKRELSNADQKCISESYISQLNEHDLKLLSQCLIIKIKEIEENSIVINHNNIYSYILLDNIFQITHYSFSTIHFRV